MSRFSKFFLTGILAAATFAPIASARPPVVVFRGGFYGPGFGWYGPGWYGPYAYGYDGYGYRVANTGTIKIESKMKNDSVYVDGGFAGKVGDMKTFHLRTGAHDIEIKTPDGHSVYQEHVNVIGGNTIKLTPGS